MAVMTRDCCRLFRYNSTILSRTIVITYLIMLNSYWVPAYFQLPFPLAMGTKLINFLSLHFIKPGEELEGCWMLWTWVLFAHCQPWFSCCDKPEAYKPISPGWILDAISSEVRTEQETFIYIFFFSPLACEKINQKMFSAHAETKELL